jgi:sulfofructose kinase
MKQWEFYVAGEPRRSDQLEPVRFPYDDEVIAEVYQADDAALDLVFSVDEFPSAAGRHFAAGFREVGGGVAANAAVTVAALGGRAQQVGRLGSDPIGDRILSELEELGVDTSRVWRVGAHPSLVSAVPVDARGTRLIVNHTDPGLFGDEAVDPDDLAEADLVLADLRWRRP